MHPTKRQLYGAILWLIIFAFMITAIETPFSMAQDDSNDGLAIDTTSQARDRSGNVIISPTGQGLATVTIRLTAQDCPSIPRERPVDVVLVIDISGSMSDSAGTITRIDALKNSSVPFLSRFNFLPDDDGIPNPQSDQIGIVTFASDVTLDLNFSRELNTVNDVIQALQIGGGTQMAGGVRQARYLLEGRESLPGSPTPNSIGGAYPVIVILTDGIPDDGAEIREEVRLARISMPELQIATIAFGSEADRALMRDISDPNKFFEPTTDQELLLAFDTIASRVQPRLAATGTRLEYVLNNGFIFGDTLSISPPPTTLTTNSIIWDGIGDIYGGDELIFSFEVNALVAGTSPAGTLNISYFSCDETTPRLIQNNAPLIDVLTPTPTPTPTYTPTPTLTPTPTPTPTPPPPNWTTSTTQTTPISNTDMGVSGALCEPSLISWLPWLVLALLLALWFWLIVMRGYKNLSNPSAERREISCWILRSLFFLSLIWVIFLFLQPVINTVCPIPESIYFWRMQGGQSGIYVTNDFAQQPAQLTELNQQGCVGCHTVSRSAEQIVAIRGGAPGPLVAIGLDGEPVNIRGVLAVYTAFSPDGSRLAYTDAQSDLYVMNIATGQSTLISGATSPTHGAQMPTWSPDGEYIAYVRYQRGQTLWNNGLEFEGASEIYRIRATGEGTPEPIITQADLEGLLYYPSYSPDGRWLAFTHAPYGNSYTNPNADIWLMDIRAIDPVNFSDVASPIEANSPNSDTWATWNRDGTRIAFNTTRNDTNYDIVVADVFTNRTTSPARLLRGASFTGVFEHLPFWGDPPARDNLSNELLALLPWLILPIILGILMLMCASRNKPKPPAPTQSLTPPPMPLPSQPVKLEKWDGIKALWKPQPALIIGVGVGGWHVLTQIKKGLIDAGLGEASNKVRLLCILAKDQDKLVEPDKFTGALLSDNEIVRWKDSVQPVVNLAKTDASLGWVNTNYLKNQGDAVLRPDTGLSGSTNRQLGRLALINNLRGYSQDTGKDVLANLESIIKDVTYQGILTTIMISDLSDDVGAGALLDIATLVRIINKNNNPVNTTRLIGHFMTSRASGGYDSNDNLRPANTVASLRELSRFQLAANAPFQLNYGINPKYNIIWDSVLFDDITIHDTNRTRAIQDPQLAIYPAISDGILLWLDESTLKFGLYDWRNKRKSNAVDKQISQRRMMVSGMGVYQYRIPFADLLEQITVRYAGQLLFHLISGRGNGDNRLQLDERFVHDMLFGRQMNAEELSIFFLNGAFTLGKMPTIWMRLFLALNNPNPHPQESVKELRQVINDFKTPKFPEIGTAFEDQLIRVLLILLNGEETAHANVDYVQKRGAKMALALSFLDKLQARLRSYHVRIQERLDLVQALEVFEDRIREVAHKLDAIKQSLIATQGESLYRLLDQRQSAIDAHINACKNLQTRTYITDMKKDGQSQPVSIANEWYTQYLLNHVKDGLAQISWERDATDKLALSIRLPQRNDQEMPISIQLNPSNVRSFEEGLLQLGRYFARQVREEFSISAVLAGGVLDKHTISSTAETLIEQSSPLMTTNTMYAPNQLPGIILSHHIDLVNKDQLKQLLIQSDLLRNDSNGIKLLDTDDPFTLTLVQTLDIVPINAIENIDSDEKVYLSETFIQNKTRPTAVFDAERNAIYYESQLRDKLRQAHRILHPLVVTALAKRTQTEIYLVAAALASIGAPSDWSFSRGVVKFKNADIGELDLTTDGKGVFFPLLDGLFSFIQKVDDETAKKVYNRYQENNQLLENLYRWSQTSGAEWLRTILKDEDNHLDNQTILNDLIAITKIIEDYLNADE